MTRQEAKEFLQGVIELHTYFHTIEVTESEIIEAKERRDKDIEKILDYFIGEK